MKLCLRAFLGIIVGLSLFGCASEPSPPKSDGAASQSAKLPAAPSGYQWYVAKNTVGTFLRPDGWFVKEESNENINALFITERDFNASGQFDVGLTVNQINDFSKHNQLAPSLYARKFMATLAAKNEVIKSGTVKGNKTDMYIAVIRGSNKGVMTDVHYIAIGDDDKDIMYLIFFEAPEKVWKQEMETAAPMLDMFSLGP